MFYYSENEFLARIVFQLLIRSHPRPAQPVILGDLDFAELFRDLRHEEGDRAPVILQEGILDLRGELTGPQPFHAEAVRFDPVAALLPRRHRLVDAVRDGLQRQRQEGGQVLGFGVTSFCLASSRTASTMALDNRVRSFPAVSVLISRLNVVSSLGMSLRGQMVE
jgi:hypothetical protein